MHDPGMAETQIAPRAREVVGVPAEAPVRVRPDATGGGPSLGSSSDCCTGPVRLWGSVPAVVGLMP